MTGMKTITFAVPCYNSAAYMDACIESLLTCGEDIEIIIVDDGSTKDDTAAKADEWAVRRPGIIRAIHQENGGHGAAVNTGLLPLEEVLSCLEAATCEVVLTGRDPAPELLARADYVTEMKKLRHPYDRGTAARQGVEW